MKRDAHDRWASPHAAPSSAHLSIIHGGPTDDSLTGGPTADTVKGLGGDDTLSGLGGSDLLVGGDGNDRLDGGSGDDVLHGQEGSNTLNGGAGDDLLAGGSGDNLFNGGADFDIVSFATQSSNLTIKLEDNYVVSIGAASDTLIGIEGVISGSGNDSIAGSSEPNAIAGSGGNDTIRGGDGRDTLIGGAGADDISTGNGDNSVWGGAGQDTIQTGLGQSTVRAGSGDDAIIAVGGGRFEGNGGNDQLGINYETSVATLSGGAGDDGIGSAVRIVALGGTGDDTIYGVGSLHGGTGDDTITGGNDSLIDGGAGLDFAAFGQEASIDLRLHGAQELGSGTVTLVGIEGLLGFGGYDNRFIGNHFRNVFDGGGGADTLMGMGGDDILRVHIGGPRSPRALVYGGAGDDKLVCGGTSADLHGGEGADTFVFVGRLKPVTESTASMIYDLSNDDVIDLSQPDEYSFVLVDHFDGKPGEVQLVYDKAAHITWLEGTTDSDPDPELLVGLAGRHRDFSNFVL